MGTFDRCKAMIFEETRTYACKREAQTADGYCYRCKRRLAKEAKSLGKKLPK